MGAVFAVAMQCFVLQHTESYFVDAACTCLGTIQDIVYADNGIFLDKMNQGVMFSGNFELSGKSINIGLDSLM
jgi:hypothetical protein